MRRRLIYPGVWIYNLTSEVFNEIANAGPERTSKGCSRAWDDRPNFDHELEVRRTPRWRGCNHFVFLRYATSLAICI